MASSANENAWMEMVWFVGVTVFLHATVVSFWSALFAAFEKYDLYLDARIQKSPPTTYSRPELWKCIRTVALLHFVLQPLGLPAYYYVLKTRVRFDGPLPSWREVVVHLAILAIIEDALFYWTHRLLHTPFLYRNFHKMHHRYKQPIALAAEYTHPVEYLLSNSLPMAVGSMLLKCHIYTFWLYLGIRLTEGLDGHSGYDLPFMPFRYFPFRPGAQVHDYHHSHNVGNYGAFFTIWDKLCGTDCSFKAFQEKERLQGKLE